MHIRGLRADSGFIDDNPLDFLEEESIPHLINTRRKITHAGWNELRGF